MTRQPTSMTTQRGTRDALSAKGRQGNTVQATERGTRDALSAKGRQGNTVPKATSPACQRVNASQGNTVPKASSPASQRLDVISCLLLATAVLFRAWAVFQARFTEDESRFWETALLIARGERFYLMGPRVSGAEAYHPGSLFFYLMALPQLLGSSPVLGGIFVALLHGLAGWLVWRLATRAAGERAGLVFLALFVFAPWDVLYADRIWLSCVAPVWGTATLYAATRWGDGPRWQAACLVLAGTLPQLHLSAPVLWVCVAFLIMTADSRRIGWRPALIAAVLVFLAYLPFLVQELGTGFQNSRAILNRGMGNQPSGGLFQPLGVILYAILFGSSEVGFHLVKHLPLGFDKIAWFMDAEGVRTWWSILGPIPAVASIVGVLSALAGWGMAIAVLLRESARRKLSAASRLTAALLLGLAAAALLLLLGGKRFYPHYINLLMPALLLPPVLALARLLDSGRRRLRAAGLALVLLIAASMAWNSALYFSTVDSRVSLSATMSMTEETVQETMPVRLVFKGKKNWNAWKRLARLHYDKPLSHSIEAGVIFIVWNGLVSGPGPETASQHGPVALERRERHK